PRRTSALPLAAVVLTGLAGAAGAAVGASQAAADAPAPHAAGSKRAVTHSLSLRGQPAPASRDDDRAGLVRPDVPPNLRTPAPRASSPTPTSSPPPSSAPATPVTATGHCVASYYDTGTTTANGEPFDTGELTAANKTLPFGTQVRVVDDATKRSVVVRINDRGPYVGGRCLDLTPAAMRALAGPAIGTAQVTYQVLGRK
ncbi:MAG: septal ring lytic transglycosylase RlpA family protein, partial [Acidothermales bacterium]|nr:septal ring lytic transglycosylase RlpA family protein [Acidothermales bacterium]